jgi:DNA-directed RNA polymerase subunit N (RpoN/RPB10)|tara:strand:- start:194 stop:427 length:234 start_codon:yes stop_codon:yes gene_type:complete
MIIPVKCFTCGEVIADKYEYYKRQVSQMKIEKGIDANNEVYLTKEHTQKNPEGIVLDNLNLNKMCCRRHFLTHVDIE